MAYIENAIVSFAYMSASEIQKIQRSVETLLSTAAGTMPVGREFGLKCDFLDYPIDTAANMYALEVVEKVRRYIPEASVLKTEFDFDRTSGIIYPTVILGPPEEDEES